jgi:hypothetical protein
MALAPVADSSAEAPDSLAAAASAEHGNSERRTKGRLVGWPSVLRQGERRLRYWIAEKSIFQVALSFWFLDSHHSLFCNY